MVGFGTPKKWGAKRPGVQREISKTPNRGSNTVPKDFKFDAEKRFEGVPFQSTCSTNELVP